MAIPDYPNTAATYLGGLTNDDMINGGHRTHFIAALQALLELTGYTKDAAGELVSLAEQVAGNAASAAAGSGTEASVSQIRAGAAAQYLSIRRVLGANEPVSLTRASTTTWDLATGINFDLVLDGNIDTLANPTNQIAGKSGLLRIKQDATGGRTIGAFGNNFVWLGGQPIIPTAANAVLLIPYLVWTSGTVYVTNGGASA